MSNHQRNKDTIRFIERMFKHLGTWPDYERVLRVSYESFLRSDSVILDVGANIGTHHKTFYSDRKERRCSCI